MDGALRMLLSSEGQLTASEVERLVQNRESVPAVAEVTVAEMDLSCFDQLLEDKDV